MGEIQPSGRIAVGRRGIRRSSRVNLTVVVAVRTAVQAAYVEVLPALHVSASLRSAGSIDSRPTRGRTQLYLVSARIWIRRSSRRKVSALGPGADFDDRKLACLKSLASRALNDLSSPSCDLVGHIRVAERRGPAVAGIAVRRRSAAPLRGADHARNGHVAEVRMPARRGRRETCASRQRPALAARDKRDGRRQRSPGLCCPSDDAPRSMPS